jgi:SAM-dependent methyltransferase
MKNKIINKIQSLNINNSERWVEEAEFGFGILSKYCKKIHPNGKVLEVGCGSGILLAMLTQKFDNIKFEGIDPLNSGYTSLSKFNNIVKASGISIKNVGYEKFITRKKYDLIYCVNVFLFLNNWRDFLLTASKWLNKDGKLVILSANCGFPYEHLFGIPVIVNKSLTFSVFKKLIIKYEKDRSGEGLWNSLNFVKKKEVLHFIKSNQSLKVFDDISIIDIMVKRFINDKEFRNRQKIIGGIGLVVQRIGLLWALKLFPVFLPYMKLEVRRVLLRKVNK